MKHQITKLIMAIGLTFIIGAKADSFNYLGTIETKLPTVIITHSNEPVSDVKDVTISVNQNGGVCNITHDVTTAMDHGNKPFCRIEWDDPQGLSAYLTSLKGVVSGAGNKTFTYTLKLFDLNTFQPIHTDTYSVDFAAPVLPDTPQITSTWQIKDSSTDLTHQLYNRAEKHLTVNAEVSPRNYTQVIKFGSFECEISPGSKSCNIMVDEAFADSEMQGTNTVPVSVTDPYEFINQQPSNFTYVWDFRPPTIVGTHINVDAGMLPKVINDYGDPIVLAHNQAAVIVQSPHANLNPMFYPTDPNLSVQMDTDELFVTNTVNYGGLNINFDLGTLQGSESLDIAPINDPVVIGQYLLYVYDFSFVRDGLYDFTFSTTDANGNGDTHVEENLLIDRFPPDIQFVINGKHHKTSRRPQVYALSDITILSWGGWDDGAEIVSATLNGDPVLFHSGTKNVKRLVDKPLPLNSTHYLAVTARDTTGNQLTKLLDFNYGQFKFDLTVDDVMQSVQPAKFVLTQSAGPYCVTASSAELAELYSIQSLNSLSRGCFIEWIELPSGIDPSAIESIARNRTIIAAGTVDSLGSQRYHFKVHSFGLFGEGQVVFEQSGQFESYALEAPEIVVGTPQIAANYVDYHYTQYDDRPLSIPVTAQVEPRSDLVLELYDDNHSLLETKVFTDARASTRHVFRRTDELPVQQSYDYKVRAYYQHYPSAYTEKDYKFYTVPGNPVRLFLEHADYALDGANIAVQAKMGKRNGSDVDYSAENGQWEIGFYTFNLSTKKLETLVAPVLTDSNGIASLVISSDQILSNQSRILARAKLVTPHNEVEIVRQLSSLYNVPVLSMGAISASLTSSLYQAPVPARFAAKIDYAGLLDQNTAGDIIWQKSLDGQNWDEVARKSKLTHYMFSFDQPGSMFVRAIIVNQLNGALNYTNTVTFTGVAEPLINVMGSTVVAKGALGKYQYALNEFAQEFIVGNVEYSLDNKATWQAMSPTEYLTFNNPTDLTIRTLVNTGTQPPYYIYDNMQVRIIDPRALSVSLRSDKNKAEIGDTVSITAKFLANSYYQPDDFRYQVITPQGDIINDALSVQHTLTESDFSAGKATFLFRSWVDGLQSESISTKEVSIAQILYNGLPPTDLVNQTPNRVNYSTVNLRFVKPNSMYLPESVTINEDYKLPLNGELEFVAKTSHMLRLIAKKEGTHPIEVRYYDNRGNERTHIEFVTIHSPPEVRFDMNTRYFTEHFRPPFRLSHSLAYRFGSPSDRIKNIEWTINGESINGSTRTIMNHTLDEAKEYTIGAKITSNYGQTAEKSHTIILLDNKKPDCEPYWEQRNRVKTLFANCKDFDGKVMRVGFTYMLNANDQTTVFRYFNPSISFVDGLYDDATPINVVATDDSDEQTALVVNWP